MALMGCVITLETVLRDVMSGFVPEMILVSEMMTMMCPKCDIINVL